MKPTDKDTTKRTGAGEDAQAIRAAAEAWTGRTEDGRAYTEALRSGRRLDRVTPR